MPIRFFLIVNKQGQTKLSKYYPLKDGSIVALEKRIPMEGEISRRCLRRKDNQVRYASLFFILGCDPGENELGMMEFVHCCVETLDHYFQSVVMYNIEKVHILLDEMIVNNYIVEHSKMKIVEPVQAMDKAR
ncbi:hypothetical protein PROFUN_00071 [Planoprotostelium fungivorum]|uniref:AP complex subunit sigma n=1 Tax=Planoprotostelium fungivorum TaxID=1890364 RepID=A0A2P6P0M0_9EUKA|nr:hypothetical protein PROFUN_00071 [Planoprotostelium fungivorum]